MTIIKPGCTYGTKSGVVILVVKVDDQGVWGCSRHYIPEEAKPDWDLDGKYRLPGPSGMYDIGEQVHTQPRFTSDPDLPSFDWANNTERQSQARHRKHSTS